MSHKIYGQQVLFIEEDNPIVASTPEEMVALLTSDNVGKFVKYIGETRDFEFSTPTGRNIPVNPVTVDNSVEKWYFDNSVTPDFTQFAWSDLSSSETESIRLCTVAVPGTTSGDKYILSVTRFPKGSRFASSWPQLKEDAYTIRIPYTSPSFTGYVYVSTEELANQIRHTGANPPQVHQGWMVKQGTWNKDDYGWWVTNVSQQDVWGGYISKDGKWVAEVINTNLSLVKDAFYKISEETDIVRYYELPALTNEGAAADLAEGKELINSNGEKVVGTASGGGGQTTGDYFVKVIDYDGTVLLEKRGNNGDGFDLPSAPSHEGLVFQEWSASCPITDGKVVIDNNNIMAGAVYTTVSGQNEFDITLTKVTGLAVTFNMDGTKDWGDGTSDTNTTHTYTAYGDYTIKCNGTNMSSGTGLFGQGSSSKNYYCTEARFATVTSIAYALNYCYSLTNVIISNSVTSMGSSAFNDCSSLTNVIIPNRVTKIGSVAFFNCYSLTNVIIPNGVTSIGDSAFYNCCSLTNVIIPNSVTSIGGAFYNCRSLTNVIIPNGVTSMGSSAFSGCSSLTNVIISNSVTSIDTHAFFNCHSLTNVIIPNSVTSIGDMAFISCYSLTNLIIPNSVTSIGSSTFDGCRSLTNVIIPNGVTSIGNSTFYDCHSLTSIAIPSGVTSINSNAFYSCYSLTKYDFSQHTSVPTLSNTNAFTNINNIAKIIVPDSLYDEWIAASNWSTYANYIYKASEVA